MSRSIHRMVRDLHGVPQSDAQLFEQVAPKRRQLHTDRLLPGALAADALAACDGLGAIRVAVIGAGFAGLTAAWYLRHSGLAVTVFEASDRIGGRVLTDHNFVPGKVVEAGAELIGSNHPMWIDLAAAFGLRLVRVSKEKDYESAGLAVRMRLGDYDLTDQDKELLDRELLTVFDSIGREAAPIDPVSPWLSTNAQAYDQESVSHALDRHCGAASSLTRTVLEFGLGNDNCAPVSTQSYLGLLALVSAGRVGNDTEGLRGYWEKTEIYRCHGGNQQLAYELARPLTDVRFGAPVQQITVAETGIGISWGGAAPAEEAFDYAVLTAPPTSWPAVEPSADWRPQDRTMSHGPAVKYLSAFDRTFWADSGLAPSAVWDQLGSVWEGTDRQDSLSGGFDLSVYSGGQYVLGVADYPNRLAAIYPGYAPRAARLVDWPNTPYIWTGYSVPSVGQVCSVGHWLSIPHAGRIVFAGEQAQIGYFGYMEGALQSGARAALSIVGAVCPAAVGSAA